MPRKQWDDGLEIIYQDLSATTSAMEIEVYDRLVYELMNRQQNVIFGDSFFVSYVNGTQVSVKSGNGVYFDNTQVDPEPMTRLLHVAANTAQNLVTPDASNPRIDLVCIQAARAVTASASRNYKDPSSGLVTSVTQPIESDWVSNLQIVAGTPSGSPVSPSVPSGWIAIAKLTVSASTGIASQSAISDVRVRYRRGQKVAGPKVLAYTVDLDDETILLNCSGGNFNTALPPVANCYDSTSGIGKRLTFINVGATGIPSVIGNASELISDANSQAMGPQYSTLTIQAGPTQWYLI